MTSTGWESSGLSENKGLDWGAQSRGLIKPGLCHSYLRIFLVLRTDRTISLHSATGYTYSRARPAVARFPRNQVRFKSGSTFTCAQQPVTCLGLKYQLGYHIFTFCDWFFAMIWQRFGINPLTRSSLCSVELSSFLTRKATFLRQNFPAFLATNVCRGL